MAAMLPWPPISATNLPPGLSASFSQNPTTTSSVLTISANSAATPAAYLLEVAGTSGTQTITADLQLNVEAPTTTNLTVTPDASARNAQPSYTLAATVLSASGQPVRGQVNFCDVESAYCTDIHLLGTAQLTSAGTALLRLHPAAGTHSYKAVFSGTPNSATPYAASSSTVVNLTAKGPTTTTLAASGSSGDYTLTATVAGAGAVAPGGTVSFTDSSQGSVTPAGATLGSGTQSLSFTSPTEANSFSEPIALASADFNGDGISDLAVVSSSANTVTILSGNGDGTFTTLPNPMPTGQQPQAVVAGDFNADGNPDLAVANFESNTVTLLLGNDNGTFTASSASPGTGIWPVALAAGDFNRDGNLDLAVVNVTGTITILLGSGDGTFTATASSPATGNVPKAVATGDFNGDGIPDLAVTNSQDNTVSILLGYGDGSFSAASVIPAGTTPMGIVAGDFNGDGKMDLAVANSGSSTVTILLGNGDGTFAAEANITASLNQPSAVVIADLNGDGIPDLAVTNIGNNTITVFTGSGDGTFNTSPYSLPSGNGAYSLVSGDFNQDGIPDLGAGNFAGMSLTIQLGNLTTTATATASGVAVTGSGTQTIAASFPGDKNYVGSISSGTSLSPGAQTATPAFSIPPGPYTSAQTVKISDSTANATIYYTTNGTTPTTGSSVYSVPVTVSSTETVEAIAVASGYSQSAVAKAAYTISIPISTEPAIGSMSPAYVSAGGTTFTLTVNGSGFVNGSTVYWGTTSLTTTYVSATQLTAAVPASNIANTGSTAITVQTPAPGGGTSNSLQFEVDSALASSDAPSFTVAAATVAAGSTASYAVKLPSVATNVSVSCLNLPASATCAYSASTGALTISTGAATPKGTYQVTAVFNETVPAQSGAWVLLPFFLLVPLYRGRKKLRRNVLWSLAWLTLLAGAAVFTVTGCGGGGSTSTPPPQTTQQVSTSGVVTLTVQ